MRYYQLLREYNEARLINDFGRKLVEKWRSEQVDDTSNANEKIDQALLQKNIVEEISKLDRFSLPVLLRIVGLNVLRKSAAVLFV